MGVAMTPRRTAVFIDKDGTLVHDVPYNVDPDRLAFTPHAVEGLRLLQAQGHALVIVTNQPGIALGLFDSAALDCLTMALVGLLHDAGVRIDAVHACPHAPGDGCDCRKPLPGLLLQAARELNIDLSRSWMVGDILNDVEAGHRAGCRSVLLDVGNETEWIRSPLRVPQFIVRDLGEAARRILAYDATAEAA